MPIDLNSNSDDSECYEEEPPLLSELVSLKPDMGDREPELFLNFKFFSDESVLFDMVFLLDRTFYCEIWRRFKCEW